MQTATREASRPQEEEATATAPWVSVVVPVHNEEQAIGHDLDVILETMARSGLSYEVIVVDDGSTDGTAAAVRARQGVQLLQHRRNLGTGAALKTGICQARGEVIAMTDGDGSYPNHEIPRLLSYLGEYDLVIGARQREMGTVPWLRAPVKAFIRLLASYLTNTPIPDLNSGLRCFRRDVALRFFSLLPAGFSWVSTITLAFLSAGYAVNFVPVDYYRRQGRSHFHPLRDTSNNLALVVRTVMYFNPLKFFMPAAAALLLVGLVKLGADVVRFNFHIAGSTIVILLTAMQVGALGLLADLIVKRGGLREDEYYLARRAGTHGDGGEQGRSGEPS